MAERNVTIDLRAKTAQYERNIRSATRQTEGLNASLGQFAKTAATVGAAGIAVGVAAIGAAAVKVGIDSATGFGKFETSLSRIEGLVGIAHEQVVEFGEGIKDLAGETARAPQELADAMFFITSAGLEGADALDALEVSAKAAAAGLGETETIADVVTSAMNAYGDTMSGAAEATDVLVATVREGKAAAPELASAMGRVIPMAVAMGVSFDEVGAAMAAMTRVGLDAAESGTALRGIMQALLSPTADANKALAELGLSAAGLRQEIRDKGLFETLEHMVGAFEGQDEATQRVFGNVRALTGVMALMGENADATRGIFDSLATSTGALGTAFDVAKDTGAFKMEQAMVDFKAALLDVGEQVLPKLASALETIAPKIPDMVDAIGDLSIAMVNLLPPAVDGFVDGLAHGEKALLNFQIAVLRAQEIGGTGLLGLAGDADYFVKKIGSLGQIDAPRADWDAAKESQLKWLRTQRTVVEQLYVGEDAARIAMNAIAELTAAGAMTEDRFAALGAKLGYTNAEMYEAAQGAYVFAGSIGATADDLAALESAMEAARDAARGDFTAAMREASGGNEILGDAAWRTASALDDEAASLSGDVVPSLSDFRLGLIAAEEAQESLADTVRAFADPAFKAVKALKDLHKAEASLADVQGDSEATAEDVAAAQFDLVEATLKAQAALDDVDGTALEATVDAVTTALALSDDEARRLLETLGLLDGKTVSTVIDIQTRGDAGATGGINVGGFLAFGSGGVVPGPLGAPRLAVVHGGEEVLTARDRTLRPQRAHQAPQVTVNVIDSNHRDLQGDIAAGLVRAGVTSQVDLIGAY